MQKNRLVALLPLKANSERIPRKNFRPMAGKPLVRWILDTLLSIEEIDFVVINTDARTILAECGIVEGERICIRDRKPELCGDLVSMNLILEDDIAAFPANMYLMTHTTNPLLGSDTIRSAIKRFDELMPEADSLFSVNRFQTRFYRANASAVNHDPSNLIRTQDLEPWYEENSCLYLFTSASFTAANSRIGCTPTMFETPPLESLDIDEPHQWFIAEAVLEKLQREMEAETKE